MTQRKAGANQKVRLLVATRDFMRTIERGASDDSELERAIAALQAELDLAARAKVNVGAD